MDLIQHKYKSLIQNTMWCVPPDTLLAYEYSSEGVLAVEDQTVWIIGAYDRGYFLGDYYAYISRGPDYSDGKFIGSISDSGSVYMTFFNQNSLESVRGVGEFKEVQGIYRFTMQMQSGIGTTGICHWSYMVSIDKNDPYFHHLPGVGTSVPEFLENF